MHTKLRYEFYLPVYYNDGKVIEKGKYRLVKDKILERFTALSMHPADIEGTWVEPVSKKVYSDVCIRFEVTVDNNEENEEFFRLLKGELKELFKQSDIYMVSTPVKQI